MDDVLNKVAEKMAQREAQNTIEEKPSVEAANSTNNRVYGGTGNLNSSFGIILANVLNYGYKRFHKRISTTNCRWHN